MRLLTIGAKHAVNEALATLPGLEVHALTSHQPPESAPYTPLPYEVGSKLHLRSIQQVRQAIRQWRPEVIHAFYPRPLAHAVLATTSLGNRTPLLSYRGITSLPSRWSPDAWLTYLSPRVAGHACESAAVRDALVQVGVPAERCHVVHNCLNRPAVPVDRGAARRAAGLSPEAFVVMMVANMRHVKGADLLLQAALQCRHLSNLQVVLVGRVLEKEVERLAADPRLTGIVRLAGYRPDAAELVAGADLFVMPSRAEALSVALLEAMSQGTCPVVSDAGGMKEAVRHGVDGVVFPRENAAALAQVIEQLYTDRDQVTRYAASAQQRGLEHFSPLAMAHRVAAMYPPFQQAA